MLSTRSACDHLCSKGNQTDTNRIFFRTTTCYRENLNMSDSEPNGETPLKTSGSQREKTNKQTPGPSQDRENLNTSDLEPNGETPLKTSGSQREKTNKQTPGSSQKLITTYFQQKKKGECPKQKTNAQPCQIPASSSPSSLSTPGSSSSASSTPTKKGKANAKKTKKTPKKATKETTGGEEGAGRVGVQGEYTPVVFGLETTDFNHKVASIMQIAAMPWVEPECMDLAPTFEVYTFPTNPINRYAGDVNGFGFQEGRLFKYGSPVEALSLREGLEGFLKYLGSLEAPPERRKKLLLAHNASKFTWLVLVRHIETYGLLEQFEEEVIGFADTIVVFSDLDPERKKDLKSYRRDDLASDILGKSSEKHDCLENVKKIVDLLNEYKTADKMVRKNSYNLGFTTLPLLEL